MKQHSRQTILSFQSLIQSWFWMHLIALAGLAFQRSTPSSILGLYSPTSAAILVFFIITSPIVWITTRWLSERIHKIALSAWANVLIAGTSSVLLYIGWAYHLGPTNSYIIVRLYFTAVLFTIAVWALQNLDLPGWMGRLTVVLGIGSMLLLLYVSTFYPGVKWTDEGYTANAAWEYIQTGKPLVSMLQPTRVEAYSFTCLGLGVWFRIFGVGFSAARVFVFIVGLISLGMVFAAARQLYSNAAAWAAVIAGAFGLITINYLYRDIEVMFLLAVAFLLFVIATRSKRDWLHILVGFAVGFSIDGHPVAYRFGIAFGLAYLIEWIRLLLQAKKLILYKPVLYLLIGGLAGVGIFVGFYGATNEAVASYLNSSPFVFNNGERIFNLLEAQLSEALKSIPLLLGSGVWGIVVALHRGDKLDRLLVSTVIVPYLTLAVLYTHHRQYYLMHSIVPFSLLVAGLFNELEQVIRNSGQKAVMAGAVVLLVAASLGMLTAGLQRTRNYEQALAVASEIHNVVPQENTVVGIDPFYFVLWDYPAFTDITAASQLALRAGIMELEAWSQINPDAVILVNNYPLTEHVAVLREYVDSNRYYRVRCWIADGLGRVELFMREPDERYPDCMALQP